MERRPTPAVGAFVVRDGKVLLVRRSNPPGRNKWSLPGGRLRFGERAASAVVREVREETGLEVEVIRVVDVVDVFWRAEDGSVVEHFVIVDFLCDVVGGSLAAGSDALEARWFGPDEVEGLEMTESTRAFLEEHFLGRGNRGLRGKS
ncbi:MAG: NUDIX hydrolase [Candidatus Caldarchaeales archaeon]